MLSVKPKNIMVQRLPSLWVILWVHAVRSGKGRPDVFSAGCQLDGRAQHERLNDEIEYVSGEFGTLQEVLAPFDPHAPEADPAEKVKASGCWPPLGGRCATTAACSCASSRIPSPTG